ncbi:hypothetical protein AOXY_G28692 [Acipenser oxyrinchus oxyrinchus]|uniref:Uncharacterized protein n=1 Tax=Acipenser oxyrinchus oxyrinchus TaxID=40147 RepID=A0AAD8CMJ1_ACIOX|nr:hypothetical protein AOXY_G28692 [Acipenser oxyrinchus oxyrinchus]
MSFVVFQIVFHFDSGDVLCLVFYPHSLPLLVAYNVNSSVLTMADCATEKLQCKSPKTNPLILMKEEPAELTPVSSVKTR